MLEFNYVSLTQASTRQGHQSDLDAFDYDLKSNMPTDVTATLRECIMLYNKKRLKARRTKKYQTQTERPVQGIL